jgi:hypothetical protein
MAESKRARPATSSRRLGRSLSRQNQWLCRFTRCGSGILVFMFPEDLGREDCCRRRWHAAARGCWRGVLILLLRRTPAPFAVTSERVVVVESVAEEPSVSHDNWTRFARHSTLCATPHTLVFLVRTRSPVQLRMWAPPQYSQSGKTAPAFKLVQVERLLSGDELADSQSYCSPIPIYAQVVGWQAAYRGRILDRRISKARPQGKMRGIVPVRNTMVESRELRVCLTSA